MHTDFLTGFDTRHILWEPREGMSPNKADSQTAITVEVVLTTPAYTFGPLLQKPLHASAYGPPNFTTTGERFTESYMLHPGRITGKPHHLNSGTDLRIKIAIDHDY
jgi:hypothetical protein